MIDKTMKDRCLTLINNNPELLSLLYDISLMPEQLTTKTEWVSMALVCAGFEIGQHSAKKSEENDVSIMREISKKMLQSRSIGEKGCRYGSYVVWSSDRQPPC